MVEVRMESVYSSVGFDICLMDLDKRFCSVS